MIKHINKGNELNTWKYLHNVPVIMVGKTLFKSSRRSIYNEFMIKNVFFFVLARFVASLDDGHAIFNFSSARVILEEIVEDTK